MQPMRVVPMLLLTVTVGGTAGAADSLKDRQRRIALRDYAAKALKSGAKDHCDAFAKIAQFAATNAVGASMWLEDMRLVVIGADWRRRSGQRGEYFTGVRSTASGFKEDLRDDSPQVEHAMAAIYLGKMAPPGAGELAAGFRELVTGGVPESKVEAADYKLWAYGADIGARLSDANLPQVSSAIRRTLCR